ncbi:MAG: 3-dehydroquinate synthase [Acidobacteria bacterium]|nr:3-dehydroquinate synthase [Acidobacteriota bacterium]MCB9398355.1 3-dehydroquinate synthase [Acidobacteriota bacterium]
MTQPFKIGGSQVVMGSGIWPIALADLDWSNYSAIFVQVQPPVFELFGAELNHQLNQIGLPVHVRVVVDGERLKTLDEFAKAQNWLAENGADRKSVLLAMGGGVVGDFTGFVASCYMRGMDWIFVPTTLLAQQDASVGGKVAVNLSHGKNLVGQFWPPRWVLMDPRFFNHLTARHQAAGYMELLKHSVLAGPDLYASVCQLALQNDWQAHLDLLKKGLLVKAEIVERDPTEKNERRLLNLGHTLAHAIETASQYEIFHGEAVGLGLMYATLLGNACGHRFDWSALHRAVRQRMPPNAFRPWDLEHLLDLTQMDKKSQKGVATWIVPAEPGQVELRSDLERPLLKDVLQQWLSLLSS